MRIEQYTIMNGGHWVRFNQEEDFVDIKWGDVGITEITICTWEHNVKPVSVKLTNGSIYDYDYQKKRYIKRQQPTVECPVPNPSETDPAKCIVEEQGYMLCRFDSIYKLMNDLQNDIAQRYGNSRIAEQIRYSMRSQREARELYMLESRHKLSKIVNKTEDKQFFNPR